MPKVTGPLFSLKAVGQFGKSLIFKRGGIVVNYFKPRNPNSAAQQAQREAFKELYVSGLTQEQADLLYSAIAHLHDDLYSPIGHDHDDLYSPIGHQHKQVVVLGGHGGGQTIAAGATGTLALFATGFLSVGGNVPLPYGGTLKKLYIRIAGTQPASGSLVFTVMKNNVATDIVATCAANGSGITISDTSHTLAVSAGDLIYLRAVNNASAVCATVGVFNLSLELDTTS